MANIYALTYFNISPKVIEFPSIERIRVTILSIAAPAIAPVITPARAYQPQPKVVQAPEPSVTKMLVKATAPDKIFAPKPKTQVISRSSVPTPRVITRKPIAQKPISETPKISQKPKPEIIQALKTPIERAPTRIVPPKTQTKLATKSKPAAADKGNGKDASTVIHNANYRKRTAPRYPRRAFELGQQGVVTLAALILPNGHPQSLKIEKSSGHRLLDKAAISAVKKWEFEPLVRNGQKIQSWVRVPVRFVIN
ncbi:MAG: energy transducer TonB [Sneathiella sp.]